MKRLRSRTWQRGAAHDGLGRHGCLGRLLVMGQRKWESDGTDWFGCYGWVWRIFTGSALDEETLIIDLSRAFHITMNSN